MINRGLLVNLERGQAEDTHTHTFTEPDPLQASGEQGVRAPCSVPSEPLAQQTPGATQVPGGEVPGGGVRAWE